MKRRRRLRVRSCIDYRPVRLRMTSLAIGPIMNGELKDLQRKRKARIAATN